MLPYELVKFEPTGNSTWIRVRWVHEVTHFNTGDKILKTTDSILMRRIHLQHAESLIQVLRTSHVTIDEKVAVVDTSQAIKVQLIKYFREQYGIGLKPAKDLLDQIYKIVYSDQKLVEPLLK